MNPYKSSAELKACAKEHLFGKYGTVIGANLLITLISLALDLLLLPAADTTTAAGTTLYYVIAFVLSIVSGLLSSGIAFFYLKVVCSCPLTTGDIFQGLRIHQTKALQIQLWISLLNYVLMLPFIVVSFYFIKQGGFAQNSYTVQNAKLMLAYTVTLIFYEVFSMIARLIYSQSFFLLHDFPQYSAREILALSRKMMKGQKGRLFYVYVSFLPLFLLSLLSCGIAFLWVIPYVNATNAEFYMDVIQHSGSSSNY